MTRAQKTDRDQTLQCRLFTELLVTVEVAQCCLFIPGYFYLNSELQLVTLLQYYKSIYILHYIISASVQLRFCFRPAKKGKAGMTSYQSKPKVRRKPPPRLTTYLRTFGGNTSYQVAS